MLKTAVMSRVFLVVVASVALSAGLLLVLVTTQPAEATFPGRNGKIAFHSNHDGSFKIYTMNPDGSDQRRLTSSSGNDTDPAWSADGKKIAFTSGRNGDEEIFVMDSDGGNVRQITRGTPQRSDSPSWSPDGKRLVFQRQFPNHRTIDLFVVNADGTGTKAIIAGSGEQHSPDWSPDGKRIVYEDYRVYPSGNVVDSLCTIAPNGTARRCFETNYTDESFSWPRYSANGQLVLFSACGADCNLYTRRSDGTGGRVRVPIDASNVGSFNLSPDGAKLAYSKRIQRNGNWEFAIFTANRDGSGERQLTFESRGRGQVSGRPNWQPVR